MTGRANAKRIGVAGCKHTTKDLILGLRRRGFIIDHCVTISPEKGEEQEVAGYYDLRPFLEELKIPYTVARKYSLKDAQDEEELLALKLDLLLVMGWQRLIPDWFLKSLGIGAFGMHGSSKPLPHGRGRSPMNWSLIQNKTLFYTHLFQYKPGVDDGPIVGVQTFDITPWDDCHTLHLKNTVAMVNLCAIYLPGLLDGTAEFTPQPKGKASYYPKRNTEDGLIYWSDCSLSIYNLVRAVTRPFPGAFSYLDNRSEGKLFIWRCIPFDTKLTWRHAQPGEIVEAFYDETFVVKTGDSSILVLESQGFSIGTDDIGRVFGTLDTPRKAWTNLPD